ncbi:hypothetical protein MMC26_002653 [Xylographa opegraphella]|nr:hypothetical protein [Xylographa opegraphella]
MANPSQLYLLADHIKLSLLERQRAISLGLEPSTQDANISRSLESMREGIEAAEAEASRLEAKGDEYIPSPTSIKKRVDTEIRASSNLLDQAARLRTQYNDLMSQFRGFAIPSTSTSTITQPNTPALQSDFASAQDTRTRNLSKSVRFTDNLASDAQEDANRAALFPYKDDPDDGLPDQSNLDNQQIHEYHKNVIRDQDEQLDRLGHSISRQRDLSIQIGDELDEHVQMLDDVEEHVDRHQGRLDGARRSLGKVARKANDNKQITAIVILIIVLVLLIIVLK